MTITSWISLGILDLSSDLMVSWKPCSYPWTLLLFSITGGIWGSFFDTISYFNCKKAGWGRCIILMLIGKFHLTTCFIMWKEMQWSGFKEGNFVTAVDTRKLIGVDTLAIFLLQLLILRSLTPILVTVCKVIFKLFWILQWALVLLGIS